MIKYFVQDLVRNGENINKSNYVNMIVKYINNCIIEYIKENEGKDDLILSFDSESELKLKCDVLLNNLNNNIKNRVKLYFKSIFDDNVFSFTINSMDRELSKKYYPLFYVVFNKIRNEILINGDKYLIRFFQNQNII